MLAAVYRRHGPPVETIELEDREPGSPGPGEALVAVEAAPVHIADLLYITGEIEIAPETPAVAGIEGVGRILATGHGVTGLGAGDRVLLPRRCGTFSQQLRLPAGRLVKAPVDGDPLQLSLVPINAATAYYLVTGVRPLERGDWLIQDAANSSCGRFIIGIARLLGLRTVNVVRRPELVAELRALGGNIVLLDGDDLHERVREATGDASIRYAIDAVAGTAVTRLAHCLATGGVIANYGLLSGEPCEIPPDLLFLRNLRLQGFFLNHYEPPAYSEAWAESLVRLAGWVADGRLRAKIAASYPLTRIREALRHEQATGAARDGKVIVLPNA